MKTTETTRPRTLTTKNVARPQGGVRTGLRAGNIMKNQHQTAMAIVGNLR